MRQVAGDVKKLRSDGIGNVCSGNGPEHSPRGTSVTSIEEKLKSIPKRKNKKHLGKKEREKLRAKAANEQKLADEEAGCIAAGGSPSKPITADDTKADSRSRYTVFVGNLPYDATREEVFQHFDCHLRDMVLEVRLQHDRGTGQFRGTCFVDFKDAISLGKAFKLHHSKFMDRKINVEPTVGGGGKGENRTKKMTEKKKELEKLRKKRLEREKKTQKQAGAKKRGFGAQKRSLERAHAQANGEGARKKAKVQQTVATGGSGGEKDEGH
jgi:nucleolar protein 6